MKTLYLMRHGKSDWSDPGLADIDRPLKKRGRKAAEKMGVWMKENKQVPDLVVSSPAERAKRTAEIFILNCDSAVRLKEAPWLYDAEAEELLPRLKALPQEADSILVVGHNPVLEELAALLISGGTSGLRLATGAIARIDLQAERWDRVEWQSGSLWWSLPPELI